MAQVIPVLRPLKLGTPGDVPLFSKTYKALRENPVETTLDWIYLPSPATIRLPFALVNQQGATRYVQTQLVDPPTGWSDSPINQGSVAHGATMVTNHMAQRTAPTFTAGEYDETITLAVRLYRDSAYSDLDVTLIIEYLLRHYKSDDPAWSLIAFHDFEASAESWCRAAINNAWSYAGTTAYRAGPGYASSYSIYAGIANQTARSLMVYSASFASTSAIIADTLEIKFLDTNMINLSATWIGFSGYIRDLTKPYFGIPIPFTTDTPAIAFYMRNGYSRPTGATKIRFSGAVMFHTDNYWRVDRIRIVYKTT